MKTGEMNELIHTPTRLKIMSALAELGIGTEITFSRLQDLLDMTPGNLSAHVKRLEEAEYLTVERGFTPRGVAQTSITITPAGEVAFTEYVQQLKSIIGTPLATANEPTRASKPIPGD